MRTAVVKSLCSLMPDPTEMVNTCGIANANKPQHGVISNLNWTKISVDDCKAQGGIVIEKADGKKVAKKL